MFESLGKRLQDIMDGLRGRGKLTENDVKAAMREIRVALLEADVNFNVAKDFIQKVQEKAIGTDVLNSLTPGQQVIKIVYDELIEMLGADAVQPTLRERGNVWFMVGLQGAGKTTTTGKLAAFYKSKGRRPLLVAADTQRPAARDQLKVLGKQVGVSVLEVGDNESPAVTKQRLADYLQANYHDLVIVDTAGRLQIDETLMDALSDLKTQLEPSETFLVVDAMTGQEALNVSQTFDERIGLSGLIMTKLDGDARGGAALSARAVTGKPIMFAGISEKIGGLEPFYPGPRGAAHPGHGRRVDADRTRPAGRSQSLRPRQETRRFRLRRFTRATQIHSAHGADDRHHQDDSRIVSRPARRHQRRREAVQTHRSHDLEHDE